MGGVEFGRPGEESADAEIGRVSHRARYPERRAAEYGIRPENCRVRVRLLFAVS